MAETLEFYARCASGFENQLATELKRFNIKRIRPLKGGVAFFSDLEGAYRACLWSRVASRIGMVLARIDATDAEALYQGVQTIDWAKHIGPEATIAIFAQGVNDQLRNTQFTAVKAKDAICDQLRARRGFRPDVCPQRPDVPVTIAVRQAKATVSLDLSGEPLHRRGYREPGKQSMAPLKEALAAAILLESGWQGLAKEGAAFIDPLCGSGTLVIEAAMIAADMAPGILRDYWGFAGWLGHDQALWDKLVDEADDRLDAGLQHMPHLIGADNDPDAIALARMNAKRSGLAEHLHFFVQDVARLAELVDSADTRGLVATNPPYGERLSSTDELPALYAKLAQGIDALEGEWSLSVITPDDAIDRILGYVPFAKTPLFNGSIEAVLRQYRLAPAERNLIEFPDPLSGEIKQVAVLEKNSEQFAARLRKVAKERKKWARRQEISCYRVYDADLPDYAVAIDRYEGTGPSAGESYLTIAEYHAPKTIDEDRALQRFEDVLTIAPLVVGVDASHVFSKVRKKEKGGGQYRDAKGVSRTAITQESGYSFELDLGGYLDTGIFLDHRLTRQMVGEMAKGKRFLNLFAYTGTASVYAAGGGAIETTTVDLSQTYLAWAKRNMALNGFTGLEHHYIHTDVLDWLEKEQGSGRSYDLVFVDPPTFSNSKSMGKNTWSVQRDHVALLKQVVNVLSPDGKAVFSCNLRNFKPDEEALRKQGIALEDITAKTIPEDFSRNTKIHHCYLVERA